MTGLLLLTMFSGALLAPIKVDEGTWTVLSAPTMAGEGRPDSIVTHCNERTLFVSMRAGGEWKVPGFDRL